jgi:hypothetical protein
MDYTLTRIDPNGENDRYPLQKQEIVTDPLEQEVNKTCSWANSMTWSTGAVRTQSGLTTLAFLAATLKW